MIRALIIFLLFILAAILAGPILAYPVHLLLADLSSIPYHKLITHLTLLCGLIASGFYLRYNGLFSGGTLGYGLQRRRFLFNVLAGCGAGLLIMLVVEACLLALGVHEPESGPYLFRQTATTILKALVTGFAVAVIEETIFRGALLGGLKQQVKPVIAVIVSSLVYAAVHFLKYRALPPDSELHWYTGLEMLPEALFRFTDPVIIDTFATLFIFGVFLSLLRIRHNNISLCIGIHAGVVAAIKLVRHFTDPVAGSEYAYLVNDYNNLLGWLAFAWLLFLTIAYLWQLNRHTYGNADRTPAG